MKDVKYERIFAALQQELNEGRYDVQNPFPSEAKLVRRFGVSRFTGRRGEIDCFVKTNQKNPSNRWGFARERGKSG